MEGSKKKRGVVKWVVRRLGLGAADDDVSSGAEPDQVEKAKSLEGGGRAMRVMGTNQGVFFRD